MFHCKDALEAEISAILEGLSMSFQRSELPIVIQSANSVAIAALTDDSLNWSAYGHLMMEIKKLLQLRGFVPLLIDDNQNSVARSLANVGRIGGSTTCWLHQVPDSTIQLVLAGCNAISKE